MPARTHDHGNAESPLLARLLGYPRPGDQAVIEDGVADERGRYGAVVARARAIADTLRAGRSSLNGAHVALLVPPSRGYVEAFLGGLIAGGALVPLSPLHTPREIEHVMRDAAPRSIVTTRDLLPRVDASRQDRQLVVLDLEEMERAHETSLPAPHVQATDPALILYTSGTTGVPKGVVLSHGAVAATLASLEEAWSWRREDRLLHVLPLHHTHGVVVALLGALWAGASVRFAAFDAPRVWDLLAGVTLFMAVPTIHQKLMEAHRRADAATRARWEAGARQLRLATSGSAPLPAPLFDAFERATGQRLLERYGMTEIGMALSNPYPGQRIPGTVGVPLPGVEVDIVAEDGSPARAGEPGEVRVRSPQLFSEYLGDRAATAAAYDAEGRFRTGDTGVADEAGVVRLLGRTSTDILKSGGYKLSALEIENVLREHDAIADVAVIGVPDDVWGDAVTACVVLRAGATLTLEELRAWAKGRLAQYKVPRGLRVLDALPRNAMGKVQKKALRD